MSYLDAAEPIPGADEETGLDEDDALQLLVCACRPALTPPDA